VVTIGRIEYPGVTELRDVRPGNLLLSGIGWKDCRSVLRPDVGPLPIQFGRIVHDGKEDLQDLAVAHLARIERGERGDE
jgi:hypothetical protein